MHQLLSNLTEKMSQSPGLLYFAILIFAIIIGFFLLAKGGDLLSDHSAVLAESMGVPTVVVGLTIVSIATSAPELFTSLAAIRSNATGLILGNVIGSNIANIGLIMGLVLFVKPIDTRRAIPHGQIFFLFLLTIGFTAILLVPPADSLYWKTGTVLLTCILGYLYFVTLQALKDRKIIEESSLREDPGDSNSPLSSSFMILVATAALWAGSDSLVFGAENLAKRAGVPEELIGFTLLAIGTSLPELAASISLARKDQFSMLLGNVVGSNLFNIGLVAGIAGILSPIGSQTPYPWIDYLSLVLLTGLFCLWLRGRKLGKIEGVILLTSYLVASLCTWHWNA